DKEVEEDDFEIELPDEPKAKLGEIYQLGRHRLMCGDATNEESVEQLIREDTLKCIFTSPPYNMNAKMYEEYQDNLESKKYIEFNIKIIDEWVKYLKGYLYWNISYNKNSRWEFIEILHKLATKKGMKFLELIVWDKTKGMPIVSKEMLTRQYESIFLAGIEENVSNDMDMYYLGNTEDRAYFNKTTGEGITNYWRINPHGSQLDNHQACFPVKLPAKGIKLVTKEGEIVGDPFGGSGSTLIACEQLDRSCYMMELDPKYIDVIISRWEKYTGERAELIESGN
ncbi:MAG TPA: site-specific DNA-methyltransferase, partial [Tissierellaceae bacterium]|nr:site-specific DNA-methyltransferase [Tissierellaceae bacterium]